MTLRIRVRPNVAILAPRSQPYAFSFLRLCFQRLFSFFQGHFSRIERLLGFIAV